MCGAKPCIPADRQTVFLCRLLYFCTYGGQTVLPRSIKRARKSPKYFGFDNNDSSVESTDSCTPNLTQPRKRQAGDIDCVQPSVVQTIENTAAQVEPIYNPYPSPIIGEVSPTDPRIRQADQSPTDNLVINEADM